MKTNQEIKQLLAGYYGTDQFFRHSLMRRFTYSVGVQALAESCEAYWLIDAIASHQSNRKALAKCDGLQFWKVRSNRDGGFILTCDDGNGHVVLTQEAEYTDFPFGAFEGGVADIYVDDSGADLVAVLPAER